MVLLSNKKDSPIQGCLLINSKNLCENLSIKKAPSFGGAFFNTADFVLAKEVPR